MEEDLGGVDAGVRPRVREEYRRGGLQEGYDGPTVVTMKYGLVLKGCSALEVSAGPVAGAGGSQECHWVWSRATPPGAINRNAESRK